MRSVPRVHVIGEFGQGALAGYYEKAFGRLGCETSRFDSFHRPPKNQLLRSVRRAWRRARWRGDAKRCLDESTRRAPDLVLLVKTPFLRPRDIQALRQVAPVAMVYPDDPWTHWAQSGDVLNVLAECDHVYIWDRRLVERLRVAGVSGARYLPFGFDPDDHAMIHAPVRRVSRLVFAGQVYPKRIEWLRALEGLAVSVYGHQWKQRWFGRQSTVRVDNSTPMGGAARALHQASGIGLNILHDVNANAHNMRTFEIPAAGALMVSERTDDISAWFPDDEMALLARAPDEFRLQCERALRQPQQAARIAAMGHQASKAHSYTCRAAEILDNAGLRQ